MNAADERLDGGRSKFSECLYSTMAQEANGLYSQMITISTAFFGGSLAFFGRFNVSASTWFVCILVLAWLALIAPLAILICVRWKNVEAHRHALEYIKTGKDEEYKKAVQIPRRARCCTKVAIGLMMFGLLLLMILTAMGIYSEQFGGRL